MSEAVQIADEPLDVARIEAALEKALLRAGGTHDLRRDIYPMLRAGRLQWWSRGQGAIITELVTFPNCKICNYFLAAGEMADVLALQAEIDAWAIGQGCDAVTMAGRDGWERVLRGHGWDKVAVVMMRPLELPEPEPKELNDE